MKKENFQKLLAGGGIGLFIFGMLGKSSIFPKIIDWQIHWNIDMKPGKLGYEVWEKQPFPLTFKVYFFNVSNPAEVQLGQKPIVREIGPFVYDLYRDKVNVELNKEKDSFKYLLKKTYFFNQKHSGSNSPEDYVTILNPPLVGTALQVHRTLPTALSMVNKAIPYLYPYSKSIFLTAKVKDILFEGIRIHCQDQEAEFICTAMRNGLPKTFQVAENGKDYIFSLFKHMNGSALGPWEMERGIKNSTRGEIIAYEDHDVLDNWEEHSFCNMINGSDATVFAIPSKIRAERLYSFSEELCRSVFIEYFNETEQFGIKAVRYSNYRKGAFDYDSGEMKCFCPFFEDDNFDEVQLCPVNGIIDIEPCTKSPVLISFPHFYLGDQSLLEYVQGLNPQKDLHEIFVNIEPLTATPLSGSKRVQINMEIFQMHDFDLLQNVSRGVFPIMWLDEGVILPNDWVKFLKMNFLKITLVHYLEWVLMIGGLGSLVTGGVLFLKNERILCFAKSATVDIAKVSERNTANMPAVENTVNHNKKIILDPISHNTHNRKLNVNNTNRNGVPQQWNTQVWYTGEET